MASSSSFISTSVSQSWTHDVFLSFRGEDTRKGFVDHLYMALVQQGIDTYKDDVTLDRGETIGPALFKAIQESRIVVIVFSENYAASSWCLDELAYIIDCMENKSLIVMPIFYDVDPSDVRKQSGKYGEALMKHGCENRQKVELWRKALIHASNLSGWVPKDFANGHEATCVKDIVATVSNRLSPLTTNVNKDLIGIETRLKSLKSMLKIGSGGVRMVGIWGVGGGGKTILASAAYMEISHKFKACCLLENIRDESRKHGLKKLQENMLSLVLKRGVLVGSVIEGKSMIERSLRHKSVIVVLDDVDDLNQLDALAGSHDWFGAGSRIIITTRDKHLLTRKADEIYEVTLLSHNEAIKLFSRHAYRKDEPVGDYEMLSRKAVSYAAGLPLALEILGSFLYDKDKDGWKCFLAKLKDIPEVQVMERLKRSYDGLKHDEKELFLDIACFMRRSRIDEAMTVLDACSFHPGIGVEVLVQKSLIKLSYGMFDMHDLIKEMAHYIVRGEHPNSPEKYSRIWKDKDIVDLYAMGTPPPLLETEVLCSRISVDHPHLHDVFANMKKLRWIDWVGYPSSSLPSNFQPTKLGCLILKHGKQKELWKGCKNLPNLKILDLRDSMNLTTTPDFKGLPCLERLILENCENLKEIHPSIGYHKRLVFVNMEGCKILKAFPPIIRMKKLETLNLSHCRRFQKFPDIQTNMDSLVNLHLHESGIEVIPPSVGQFCTKLVSFDLSRCSNLKRIEGSFRHLKSLKYLKLSNCCQLEKLTRDFFYEKCCLDESACVNNHMHCNRLQCFHQNSLSLKLPQFPRVLRRLDLSWCNLGDGDMPSDMSGLLNLQILDLSDNNFSRLHSSLSQIKCLKFLNLSSCKSLVELPDLPSSIAILKATQCDSLDRAGDLSKYKWLWKVSLYRNDGNKLIGSERVLHSLIQGNAVEDHLMSIVLPNVGHHKKLKSDLCKKLIRLQLPHNWYSDFSGFFICLDSCQQWECSIVIESEMLSTNSQPDHWEVFDENPESYKECAQACYVPFSSLRHTSWWNPTYTNFTFQIGGLANPKVGLVRRKGKSGDSSERPTDCSEFWDEEYVRKKAFEVIDAPESSNIQIIWSPGYFL